MGEVTLTAIEELLKKQTESINQNINNTLRRLQNSENNICKLKKRCLYLERRIRKNNIVIFGLTVDGSEIVEQTISKLNELFGLNVTTKDINNIYKIGKSSNPPIVVEFVSFLLKKQVFHDTDKLKALRGTNISVANDLCEEDRQEQKVLRKHLKVARSDNKQARIVGNKLEVEGRLYTAAELEDSATEYETQDSDDLDGESERGGGTCSVTARDAVSSANGVKTGKGKRKVQTPSPTLHVATARGKKKYKR